MVYSPRCFRIHPEKCANESEKLGFGLIESYIELYLSLFGTRHIFKFPAVFRNAEIAVAEDAESAGWNAVEGWDAAKAERFMKIFSGEKMDSVGFIKLLETISLLGESEIAKINSTTDFLSFSEKRRAKRSLNY